MPDDSKVYAVEGIAVFTGDPVGRVHTSLGFVVWDGDVAQPTGQRIHTALGMVVYHQASPSPSGGPAVQGGSARTMWARQGARFMAPWSGGQRPI